MYKHIELFVRPSGESHESFVGTWERDYVPAVTAVDGLVRYQQVLPTDPEHAEFDGLSELYFESEAAMRGALDGAASGTAVASVDELHAIEPVQQFSGEVTVQRDDVDGDTDGRYKHSAFLVRKAGMSHEQFVDYWQHNHTPIAREIESVVKYDTVVPRHAENAGYDGVAELYFSDLDDLYAALGSEGSRDYDPTRDRAREARADVDNFLAIDERPRLIGRNYLLKDER